MGTNYSNISSFDNEGMTINRRDQNKDKENEKNDENNSSNTNIQEELKKETSNSEIGTNTEEDICDNANKDDHYSTDSSTTTEETKEIILFNSKSVPFSPPSPKKIIEIESKDSSQKHISLDSLKILQQLKVKKNIPENELDIHVDYTFNKIFDQRFCCENNGDNKLEEEKN
jgi:hypothetical protein